MNVVLKKPVLENNMDYKKIHDQLIHRAKNRILEGYIGWITIENSL